LQINIFLIQAEDGIRDRNVTGVQTCALPIYGLTAESCEQRTWTCLKNCPVKSKRSAQDAVPTSGFSGRQLKNALKKLKHGKRSVIGQSTQSWETDQVGCRAADAG